MLNESKALTTSNREKNPKNQELQELGTQLEQLAKYFVFQDINPKTNNQRPANSIAFTLKVIADYLDEQTPEYITEFVNELKKLNTKEISDTDQKYLHICDEYKKVMKKLYSGDNKIYNIYTENDTSLSRTPEENTEYVKELIAEFAIIDAYREEMTINDKVIIKNSILNSIRDFEERCRKSPDLLIPEDLLNFIFEIKIYYYAELGSNSRDQNAVFYAKKAKELDLIVSKIIPEKNDLHK